MDNFFSKNLKYLRTRQGLSIADLAAKLRVSKSVLSQYELARSQPTLGVLIEIVRFFGYSMDDITDKDLQNSFAK